MPSQRVPRTTEATAVLLFLLQALRVLLSRLFGLIYDVVFAETLGFIELSGVVACVVAAFAAPLLAPRRNDRLGYLLTACLAALARIALTVNSPAVRLWSALFLIAAAGTYAVMLLRRYPRSFATALALALAIGQLLRAAGNTYDVSLRAWWLPVQILLSLAICAIAWLLFSRDQPDAEPGDGRGVDVASGVSLGALLFLETSLLGFPNVLARWTGADYTLVAPLVMAATLLPLLPSTQWGGFVLFVATLSIGWMTGHPFHQLAILAPMLLAQFSFVSSIWTLAQPSDSGRYRLPFVLGIISFLALHVALTFAFTYPYTIAFFRDKGDYIFLLAIVVLLPPALRPRSTAPRLSDPRARALSWGAAAAMLLLTTIFALPSRAIEPPWERDSFRVATYNIHYGYDSSWRFSLEEQARAIERSGADIVMLQEVDAGRITSYGVDDALWLARRLGMHQVFGATLEELSGVALLSRFPITDSHTEQLTSQLEQTAIVRARVWLSAPPSDPNEPIEAETWVDAYGTWLGLEPDERARQLEDALTVIGDTAPAVLGGDLNATPGSPTYEAIEAAGFIDPFSAIGIDAPPTSPAIDPEKRIDFVWARGLDVRDAQVSESLASDHRLVVVEFAWP